MAHFTKEDILQELAAGNRTLIGLAQKYELSTSSMKNALAKLEIDLEENEPEPIKMNNFSASDESEWDQLYKDYDLEGAIGNQARFIIAQCRVIDGMTAAQTRQYMKDNFHYQIIDVNPESIHENRMKKMISKYHLV